MPQKAALCHTFAETCWCQGAALQSSYKAVGTKPQGPDFFYYSLHTVLDLAIGDLMPALLGFIMPWLLTPVCQFSSSGMGLFCFCQVGRLP